MCTLLPVRLPVSYSNINALILYSALRYCFVENMLSNGVLHQGMYNVMQEWYKYIRENVHIQADLIGELHTQKFPIFLNHQPTVHSVL